MLCAPIFLWKVELHFMSLVATCTARRPTWCCVAEDSLAQHLPTPLAINMAAAHRCPLPLPREISALRDFYNALPVTVQPREFVSSQHRNQASYVSYKALKTTVHKLISASGSGWELNERNFYVKSGMCSMYSRKPPKT